MAVPEYPSEASMILRLHQLLDRARQVKTSDGIEPHVPIAEFEAGLDFLLSDGIVDSTIHNGVVDGAAHTVLYERLVSIALVAMTLGYHTDCEQSSTKVYEPSFVDVWNLLDILQFCIDRSEYPRTSAYSTRHGLSK